MMIADVEMRIIWFMKTSIYITRDGKHKRDPVTEPLSDRHLMMRPIAAPVCCSI